MILNPEAVQGYHERRQVIKISDRCIKIWKGTGSQNPMTQVTKPRFNDDYETNIGLRCKNSLLLLLSSPDNLLRNITKLSYL